jgi:asparagine synthase (glutamine-hydrolysing)
MARLFTATWRGVTVVASRPTLAAALAGLPVVPDQDGWASYAACGHVGGDLSVVRGVRMLAPGERQTWVRREGWSVRSERRRGVDEVVLAARDVDGETALDLAAEGVTRAVRSAADLSTGEVTLGLSGGKDSRVIAACFVAADRLPRFSTNVDTPAEGETAAHLLQLLRGRRGLRAEHRTYHAGAPQSVHAVGLHERVRRLQHAHDFQSSWTYLSRAVGDPGLRAEARPMSFTGAGGELATAYWYPPAEELVVESVRSHLMGGLAGTTQVVRDLETARVDALLDHARSLGLQGLELCDYAYLVERVRRWCTSGDVLGIVTPFLHPAFVTASFAVPPSAKRLRSLHLGLLRRTVPEWADVPFVSMSTGRSTATRVWEGDGVPVLTDLLATADGCLPRLVRREAVEAALQAVAAGGAGRREERVLQQFAWLAVASETLEPGSVRRPQPVPLVLPRAAVPPRVSAVARHVAFVKRSRLGARAWSAARDAVAHACG